MASMNIDGSGKRVQCSVAGCEAVARSKGLCNPHYQRQHKYGDALYVVPRKPQAICSVDGCTKRSRTRNGAFCEMHYYRGRRRKHYGPPIDQNPVYKGRYLATSGYVLVSGIESHPMKSKSGILYEHRFVAYEKYGVGPHECHWCGLELEWSNLVIDHLNDEKTDNREDNLVVSCSPCNRARGAMRPFIARMQSHRIEDLVDTFSHMRAEDGGFNEGRTDAPG